MKPNNYMTQEELDALHLKARRRRLEKEMHDNRYIEGLRSLIAMQKDYIKELEDRPMHKEIRELQARIRELDELVLRHGRLWAKLDLALGDKRMAGDLTCADAAIKLIRELEAENKRLREAIEGAPHDGGCPLDGLRAESRWNPNSDEPCTCWKRKALEDT